MTSLCWEVYSGTSDKGPSEIGMTSLQDTNRWPHVQRFHCIVIIYLKRRGCDIAYHACGTTAIILLVLCCHGHVNPHPSPTVVTKRADKVVGARRQSCDRNLS